MHPESPHCQVCDIVSLPDVALIRMLESVNSNFESTVSMTDFAGDKLYPLEVTPTRLTTLLKLPKGAFITDAADELKLESWNGLEILVIEGNCDIGGNIHATGNYIRLPKTTSKITAATDCLLFVKYNQFLDGDNRQRVIDTLADNKWLPGPVDGIDIRPLHVFDTESIMLLRWQHAAEFKPRLNPRGEEILVVNGLLQNRDHLYRQYNWIRNPIEDWRTWHGNTGTLAYYKSGHFPDDPIRTSDHHDS